jgi:two-component system sensor histidine kinase ChvG
MFAPRLRFGIRVKLLLASMAMLAVPWLGYTYVNEMERFLRIGQEQGVAATAQAVATALHNRARLFDARTGLASAWHEESDIYLHVLPLPMELDGSAADWPNEVVPRRYQPPLKDDGTPSIGGSFTLRVGQQGAYLFALIEVTDAHIVYRAPDSAMVESSDHVQIALQTPAGEFKRYAVSVVRPGSGAAYELQYVNGVLSLFRPQLSLLRPDQRVRAVWRETPNGYNVELKLPMSLVGDKLAFAVGAVDDPEVPAVVYGTSGLQTREQLGRLIIPSPEIQQVVQGLARSTSRIRVVDRNHRVLAQVGDLKQAQQNLQALQDDSAWGRFEARYLAPLYRKLLKQPTDNFTDETSNATLLQGKDLDRALSGALGLGRRATADGKAVIVSAAAPIWVGDEVLGAVVVEETTNAIVTLKNQALERLFTMVLGGFVIASLVLLAFSTRLSWRIRRLAQEAETAVDAKGRLTGALKASARARDEIGDLSRSFSNILDKLGHYTSYLENMASRLSHELRTPVAVVRSSLENLAMEPLPENAKIYMERAHDGITRLNTILTRMTEARRLEQVLQSAERERFDLAQVVAGCVEGYRTAYPGEKFNTRIPQGPVEVNGVPDLIAQLLDKLISNAVDFRAPESAIDVALAVEGGTAVLTVSNEGPLLPKEMEGQLFQSMVSVRPTQEGAQPHLGFGLFIARLITEFHSGTIAASNRADGRGVLVTLRLPLA